VVHRDTEMTQTAPFPAQKPAPLPQSFYLRPTLDVAVDLLGKQLVRIESNGDLTTGIIHEVEAYIGEDDLGCHARSGRTLRNEAMWGPPGHAYVYFTYGMHWLLNAVTEAEGFPAAVLLRSVIPRNGIDRIRTRRKPQPDHLLTNGPAKICQAFAIDEAHNHASLYHPAGALTIRPGLAVDPAWIQTSARIGLNTVPEPWKSIAWRFFIPPQHLKN